MESVEKSEIFPPLPQQNDDGDGEPARAANTAAAVEKPVRKEETSAVVKNAEIVYNLGAAGKEWHSKQGSTATCSCLTK